VPLTVGFKFYPCPATQVIKWVLYAVEVGSHLFDVRLLDTTIQIQAVLDVTHRVRFILNLTEVRTQVVYRIA